MAIMQRTLVLALAALLALGCSQKPKPVTASSVGQAGYAETYPTALAHTKDRFSAQEHVATELIGHFSEYPGKLDDPSWPHVRGVVDRADVAGRSGTYAERAEEVEAVQRFFSEEKDDITQRVAGSVTYAAKQKKCDVDLYGPSARGIEKAIEQQTEKRMREHNAAQRYIDENQDSLGKKNIETLQTQADEIALASYLSNVAVEMTRRRLAAMVEEAKDVESTLDRVLEEEGQARSHPSRSDKEREVAEEHYKAAQAAKARIETEAQEAKKALEQMEDREKKLREAYEKALEALQAKLDEKAKQSGSSGGAS